MSRRPEHIPRRKAFPKAVKAAVLQRSAGMCEADGCDQVGKEFDHITPCAVGGQSTEDNCKLLCAGHHREKTGRDVAEIAKADRAGGRTGQQARLARAKANGTHRKMGQKPWSKGPSVSRLSKQHPGYQSRGFGKREER